MITYMYTESTLNKPVDSIEFAQEFAATGGHLSIEFEYYVMCVLKYMSVEGLTVEPPTTVITIFLVLQLHNSISFLPACCHPSSSIFHH